MAADVPRLRLLVGGTLIEGQQVTLNELAAAERDGAAELIRFLGGPKQVLVLYRPLVYQGGDPVSVNYLVVRQDQVQACAFVSPTGTASRPLAPGDFDWAWDE